MSVVEEATIPFSLYRKLLDLLGTEARMQINLLVDVACTEGANKG